MLSTNNTDMIEAERLKTLIIKSMERQGFEMRDNQFYLPNELNKEKIRSLHIEATCHKIEERKKGLIRHEPLLLQRLASGKDIIPKKIYPKLIEVHPNSIDELLFRYASLHWSIPVSSGYGRRLRFLVVDQNNEKLIGLFGLGDPVFSLKDRDQWVGWDQEGRRKRLHHVVDAYVLGAVPPYSFLLCGKLIALLTMSDDVREAFRRKYEKRTSLIQERKLPGRIALITTISALGRSSLYNRLKFRHRLAFNCVGHTQGYGEFHFSNGVYSSILEFAKSHATATSRHKSWGGKGFRNRKEVVQKALTELGLSQGLCNHGIKREIYVSALAANTRAFLNGNDSDLDYYHQPVNELFEWFRSRWLIPRSERDLRYKDWDPQEWRLWLDGENNERIC